MTGINRLIEWIEDNKDVKISLELIKLQAQMFALEENLNINYFESVTNIFNQKTNNMAQTLEEQIDLEIKKLEMDSNNGVQWSMQIMFKSLNRIKNKAWEAKQMHKKEIINAYSEGNLSASERNKLDLKTLEEQIDLALANETNESLTNWLKEKRNQLFDIETIEQAKKMNEEEIKNAYNAAY